MLERHEEELPWLWSSSLCSTAVVTFQECQRSTMGKKENWLKSRFFIIWDARSVKRYSNLHPWLRVLLWEGWYSHPSGWGDTALVSRKADSEKKNSSSPRGPWLQVKILAMICPVSSHNLLKNLFSFTIPCFFQVELLATHLTQNLSNSLDLCLKFLALIFQIMQGRDLDWKPTEPPDTKWSNAKCSQTQKYF